MHIHFLLFWQLLDSLWYQLLDGDRIRVRLQSPDYNWLIKAINLATLQFCLLTDV